MSEELQAACCLAEELRESDPAQQTRDDRAILALYFEVRKLRDALTTEPVSNRQIERAARKIWRCGDEHKEGRGTVRAVLHALGIKHEKPARLSHFT